MNKNASASASEMDLYAITVAVGVAVWLLPWMFLGGKEAWDHPTYFTASLPVMCIVAAYAGFRGPSQWWRWPVVIVLAQFGAALILLGFGNLLPLGIIVFVILGVPMFVAARAGAWLARRRLGVRRKGHEEH